MLKFRGDYNEHVALKSVALISPSSKSVLICIRSMSICKRMRFNSKRLRWPARLSVNYKSSQPHSSALSDSSHRQNSGSNFFRPPPGLCAYLFSPMIIHAVPVAVRPGRGRTSSSCRCKHPHGLAHIQSLPPPTPSPSAPHSPHKKQDDVAHRLPGGSHASAGFPQRKSPAQCIH